MKDAIKYYQVGKTIPHCGFQLCLLSDDPQVQQLCHKVVIKGIPFPNSFHIRYHQPESDKVTAGNARYPNGVCWIVSSLVHMMQ